MFATHPPPLPLRPFVAVAHGYRVPANPTGLHRGLPSQHLTLVLELLAPLRVTSTAGAVAAHGIVGGLHVRPALIDASGPQEGVQYALTPWGCRALFGVSAGDLGGEVVDLADVLGSAGIELVERVRTASRCTERFSLVDAALLGRLAAAPEAATYVAPEVAEAWRLLVASRGRARVSSVAQQVGWGRRHLSERFRLATGLTPKGTARIARFQAARSALLSARLPLVDVALGCGYADQQHLAREWRALAGCSIGTWLREELPFVHDADPAAGRASTA